MAAKRDFLVEIGTEELPPLISAEIHDDAHGHEVIGLQPQTNMEDSPYQIGSHLPHYERAALIDLLNTNTDVFVQTFDAAGVPSGTTTGATGTFTITSTLSALPASQSVTASGAALSSSFMT